MYKLDSKNVLKIIILFSLVNSSIFIAFHPSGIFRLLIAFMMNISGVLLVTYFFKISIRKFDANLYFKTIFSLLLIWSTFTIFRGLSYDQKSLITLFGHYLMGWAWLCPLAIVFGFNINNWLLLFNFFSKLLFLGSSLALVSFVFPQKIAFGLLEWMAFLPVLLLTYFYQNKNNKKVIWLTIFSYVILTFVCSQRVNAIFLILLILFFTFEYYRLNTIKKYNKFILTLVLLVGSIYLAFQLSSFIFSLSQNKEASTDTRTFLFIELFSDMSDDELIIGRGVLGTYYSPYFAYTEKNHLEGDSSTRSVSEVGYLEMILKGGFVMMILYLLILLPAAFLGIFKSKNIIARMSGYFILSYLVLWTVSYYPVYSAEYILLWMAVGTATSRSARNIKNSDIFVKVNKRFEFKS